MMKKLQNKRERDRWSVAARRGQALVEFAIISFVLSAVVAGLLGIMVLALGSFQNNIAAESAGRELDGHEIFIKENFGSHFSDSGSADFFDPDSDELQDLTARQVYRFLTEYESGDDGKVLYDESRLIISQEDWDARDSLDLPVMNQSLLGQYIYDPNLSAYRFPGAVVNNTRTGNPTVLIPLLPKPSEEQEEPRGIDRSFNITSSEADRFYPVSDDWVAPVVIGKVEDSDDLQFRIILFHPSQPASMISIRVNLDENGRPDRDADGFYQFPVEADDGAADELISDPPSGYTLTPSVGILSGRASPYGGKFGLGESFAFLKTVRPYRLVFETSSLFRLGSSLNPIAVKYEFDEDGTSDPVLIDQASVEPTSDTAVLPFVAYESHQDQSLDLERRVVDRFSEDQQRYSVDLPIDPPASADNDFVKNVLQLLPNDGGVWRVSVAAEFEAFDSLGESAFWKPNHVLQLWLYKNGVRERLIATHNVPSAHDESISMTGQTIIEAYEGDVLQVRVFTQLPAAVDPEEEPADYNVRLSGAADSNWISFERIND